MVKAVIPIIEVAKGGKAVSITCPECKLTSYNPNDITHMYCGNCHKYFPRADRKMVMR